MTAEHMWAIVRAEPDGPSETLAVTADRSVAFGVAEELGEGHRAEPVRVLPNGAAWRVVHTWECRATVADGRVDRVEQPVKLAGASRLLLPGDEAPADRVVVDDGAADLAAAVLDASMAYVVAYSASPERARELAEQRARDLSAGA